MEPVHHGRLSAAFAEWTELAPDRRDAFRLQLRAGDPALADAFDRLVAADRDAGDFLEGAALHMPLPEALSIGTRLGAYRLVEPIGHGGMGTVYLAERDDAQFDQRVAIKLIHAGLGAGAGARFREERQILASLNHPYIGHLIDGGETPAGQPYLVMEYVAGEPITSYCDRHALDTSRCATRFASRMRISSCTATSSRRISWSPRTGRRSCSISASHGSCEAPPTHPPKAPVSSSRRTTRAPSR